MIRWLKSGQAPETNTLEIFLPDLPMSEPHKLQSVIASCIRDTAQLLQVMADDSAINDTMC